MVSQEVVTEILSRGKIYEVGGAVRDRILFPGKPVNDRDYLVTGIPYDELTAILRRHGRVDLVGQSFGVIKFTQHGDTFDITLPRTEHSTGVGHRDFAVHFDPNLPVEQDLVRRDFTINAMAIALDSNQIIDPLNGQADLNEHQIRMVYPESFADDPLRMLRAVQFAARFQFDIEPSTLKAMTKHAQLITSVSVERIAEEFNKLLTLAEKPAIGFNIMRQTGLLHFVLPELEACINVDQPGGYHRYPVFEHILYTIDACKPELRLRLAALFHDITKPQAKRIVDDGATFYGHETTGAKSAQKVLKRLRYSNDMVEDVATLVERHMFTTDVTDKGLRRLVRRVGVPLIFDLLDLRRADVIAQGMGGKTDDVDRFEAEIRAELEKKPPFSVSDLAIDGNDIMRLFSLSPGRMVGEILNYLLEQALDNPELNTPEQMTALAREFFERHEKKN